MQTLSNMRQEAQADTQNLRLFFHLRSGQVETEAAFGSNASDGRMVARGRVDALNARIREIGNGCVKMLRDIKDFKRGTYSLQWDIQRLGMQATDATTKIKELQLLRVTKELHWVRSLLTLVSACSARSLRLSRPVMALSRDVGSLCALSCLFAQLVPWCSVCRTSALPVRCVCSD